MDVRVLEFSFQHCTQTFEIVMVSSFGTCVRDILIVSFDRGVQTSIRAFATHCARSNRHLPIRVLRRKRCFPRTLTKLDWAFRKMPIRH
ncbi:protein of unknown function [Pseudorhizobium banfieldiae]|uniref:Uncharacterized protein n=1 Tax=Pseudorhizobium banfieldiae TaxID=1125847 RepID=L0NEH2_9HYPH|nr:protein of unknown function [Pseudorhizobium banfieldiae]